MEDAPDVQLCGNTLVLRGSLDATTIPSLMAAVDRLSLPLSLSLELAEFDLADSAAAVAMVGLVRRLALGRRVTLCNAPQLLAHNLYRVGALGIDSSIVLRTPREEEPYG